jgi:protocatechuate 3,4-dioxygenase alpha subunit
MAFSRREAMIGALTAPLLGAAAQTKLKPTGQETLGPFYPVRAPTSHDTDLTHYPGHKGGRALGQVIQLTGRVLDTSGRPLPKAALTVWQANAAGRYNHPDDTQTDKPLDPKFHGFGRAATDAEGRFRITTIRPGPVPGRGNALQAPHINVVLFARGLLKHLHTRIYFADEPANATDPLLSSIEDEAVRGTLLARRAEGGSPKRYHFDIVMQGENETAFLDI